MSCWSKVANGNIVMSRFVMLDTTALGKVVAATAGAEIFGISQKGSRRTPYGGLDDGNAAIAGENLSIYGDTERCLLELGGTVTIGQRLKASTGGVGIATTADGDEYGAIAEQNGVSGDLITVYITTGQRGA
jgi:hypothetical protein